jgi:Zn-dependent protease with chaperone function
MVPAHYVDGRSTRVREVDLTHDGDALVIAGSDLDLRVPIAQIKVDERLGRAPRRLRFTDGACCEVRDLVALDALLQSMGHRDGWVDQVQRRARFVLIACVMCALLAALAYEWLLPWAAAYGARQLPAVAGKSLATETLKLLDGRVLQPSKIPPEHQHSLTAAYGALMLPEGGHPRSPLLFRRSDALGANAFTLPDGTIILLDGLITTLGDDREILAVLAHELGHAHGQHALRMLLQSSAVGAFLTFYVGDVSQLLAAAPAALLQARYSQDFERAADLYGATLLRFNGMSPSLLADALTKLAASHPESSKVGYLSSHPATDERLSNLRRYGDRPANP